MKKYKKLWELFRAILYLNTFTFGGGFVIISLMKKMFVDGKKWLGDEEMLDITAIAQSTPGSVAINASILIGYKVCGVLGAITAVLATALPPLLIISVVSVFYEQFSTNIWIGNLLRGMRAGVAAVILDVVIRMGGSFFSQKQWFSVGIMCISFCAVYFLDVNLIYVILICILVGILKTLFGRQRASKGGLRP